MSCHIDFRFIDAVSTALRQEPTQLLLSMLRVARIAVIRFDQLFGEGWRSGARGADVAVDDLVATTPAALRAVLQWAHSGRVELKLDDALAVLHLADYLAMAPLKAECARFIALSLGTPVTQPRQCTARHYAVDR